MTPLKFSKDSWHFKFTNKMVGVPWHCEDICSYSRRFFFACVTSVVVAILISFITFVIGKGAYGWYLLFSGHPPAKDSVLNIFMMIDFILVGLAAVVGFGFLLVRTIIRVGGWVIDFLDKHISDAPREPTAIETMYKHFKEKTCVKIEWNR